MHSSKMTGSTRGMTMSKGQMGRRLLGVAVVGAVLSFGGAALAIVCFALLLGHLHLY